MLALTRKPLFFINPDIMQKSVCLRNPICGDALCFGYHNTQIYWSGEGCLICLASAEALCQILNDAPTDKKIDRQTAICTQIQDYFNDNMITLPEIFLPLASVKQVKSRIKCVILSTQCAINLLKGSKK